MSFIYVVRQFISCDQEHPWLFVYDVKISCNIAEVAGKNVMSTSSVVTSGLVSYKQQGMQLVQLGSVQIHEGTQPQELNIHKLIFHDLYL
ncbi:unnamed protein product [Trifolium pratense]|uniref:Uncharacterized protein n=1 Tax=Trifolium pratense TaxID=57577 RepID=A0ACB0K5D9_TRIPR|nr:unnamed protein product [Trifolium pratense]